MCVCIVCMYGECVHVHCMYMYVVCVLYDVCKECVYEYVLSMCIYVRAYCYMCMCMVCVCV